MTKSILCKIPKTPEEYQIEIGTGILNSQVPFLKSLNSNIVIITDDVIAPLYGQKFKEYLISYNLEVFLFSFLNGEHNKTRETKEQLEDQMFQQLLGRDTCIIAMGGGVVTDLVGYIAATYCRGIPLVMIPTSLLGMVDACIGGKTGVNVPYGKNMLGCIYQPKKVIIDLNTLKSISKKEISNGAVEMIKHGMIADKDFFEMLEANVENISDLNPAILEEAIFESCRIKTKIIEEDEKEKGKRQLLNAGHTFGHALELVTNHSISHGEAVGIGLIVESYMALNLGILDERSFERIKEILVNYKLPLRLPQNFEIKTILDAMALDKKSLGGKPRFVLIQGIGIPLKFESSYCTHVKESLIIKAIEWMQNDLCCH